MQTDYGIAIDEIDCSSSGLPDAIFDLDTPLVLRGLVSDWPIVQHAVASSTSVVEYIKRFYQKKPVNAFLAHPESQGRIFYNDKVDGFNFVQSQVYLDEALDKILELADCEDSPTYYVGSLEIEAHLPGLQKHNALNLQNRHPRKSIWLGNQTLIAPHFDFPDNLACCVIGQRKFTLFPPEQQLNLYVGPLDFTPAGQAISMVNIKQPDLDKHPRFEQAMLVAKTTVLQPGDAIFIPSMWWHGVEGQSPLNGLINYWWHDTPAYLGSPHNALLHALMSIRELPERQRKAWQTLFDNYVFEQPDALYEHLPEHVKQLQTKLNENTARKLRAQLINRLK